MEHGSASVTSLVIVVIAAFLTPIILHRFRLKTIPVVVAEIIVGLIIGQSGFDLVNEGMWLETLSTLGFIFLMFLSGLEIDFSAFAGKKKKETLPSGGEAPNTLVVASGMFLFILVLSLGLSYLFVLAGFIDNVFLMTLIISTISLGVVVPTLKDSQMLRSNIGQIVLLVTVIADLTTMILLAVFVSIYGGEESSSMWLLLILFGAGVAIYFVGKYFQNRSFVETMSKGTIQIDTRAVFTIILILVGISETVGAENILGAFLAGVVVALLSPNQEMVKRLDSFGYGFLIPIFFVMVGVGINIPKLFQDPKILLLMPLLFVALVIAKMIPALILRKWYSWKEVFATGSILTAKLSLVIAAATIGEKMGLISTRMEGALILVSVVSCLVAPVIFKKLYSHEEETEHVQQVAFIGSNRMTLPVVRELDPKLYKTHLYHTKVDKIDEKVSRSCFDINEVEEYDAALLEGQGVFNVDLLVASIGDEQLNTEIALYAKEQGVERVIARAESPELDQKLRENGVEVFSVFLSSKALLKALITAPNVVDILTNQESYLYQIEMNNNEYDGMYIRNFPFTGDVIMVRIFRNNESIIPHGDTELKTGDQLVVTGSSEYVEELRFDLEFCELC
ncbi:monovalent cation:proton antiporter family protein [Pontibacillus sp. ALD_SL1]|uniref:monovalent cation:proton antiporter family protein n=1 Tax=Pontibacillus sp. ALD_SL1 TaxID=2777185 RepID=UPI001A95EC08|nr:monovalent cation:proton antiporter family protein [Pontibacillus sp. ALD_SL1]QST00838.1 monovalent cation:proton antiporter family protein [Pontibacillus sp. ALD_SL1]